MTRFHIAPIKGFAPASFRTSFDADSHQIAADLYAEQFGEQPKPTVVYCGPSTTTDGTALYEIADRLHTVTPISAHHAQPSPPASPASPASHASPPCDPFAEQFETVIHSGDLYLHVKTTNRAAYAAVITAATQALTKGTDQ